MLLERGFRGVTGRVWLRYHTNTGFYVNMVYLTGFFFGLGCVGWEARVGRYVVVLHHGDDGDSIRRVGSLFCFARVMGDQMVGWFCLELTSVSVFCGVGTGPRYGKAGGREECLDGSLHCVL